MASLAGAQVFICMECATMALSSSIDAPPYCFGLDAEHDPVETIPIVRVTAAVQGPHVTVHVDRLVEPSPEAA